MQAPTGVSNYPPSSSSTWCLSCELDSFSLTLLDSGLVLGLCNLGSDCSSRRYPSAIEVSPTATTQCIQVLQDQALP
uniref:Respiratory burst oxidase protein B n=1 Tax=Arundo donax TaxID=35708 RepID=A0A0A9CHJ7_ARUDO